VNCHQRGCAIHGAIIENTVVDGLATHGQLLQIWGAVFNQVVLKGKIDRLMISADVLPSVLLEEGDRQREIQAFRAADSLYYRNVEWALDISQGEFRELCLRGLPAHLVRRDPETQIVVTREKAKLQR
jgi:hypothetical protein